MSKAITSFRGKYSFLSNFYPSFVHFESMRFAAVEDAFQAAKTLDLSERQRIAMAPSPADAKRMGRHVDLRPDWEDIKINVMHDLLVEKFQDPRLKTKLLATGDAYLEEGNKHGDRFWGTVDGKGENHLGKLLMEVRDQLKGE